MIYHKYSNTVLQAVDEMINFIDNNPLNRKSISTLFPHYYSNRNIIYAAFERETGKSIKEYRTLKLMKSAAGMIAEGELTVQQVAYRCGYRGPKAGSNFTRAFKKTLKITPKQLKDEVS
jgi:AraC-like DNA-binding protein